MKITSALRPKGLSGMASTSTQSGFTLTELMVTAVASLIVIGVTISSLITFQGMNQKLNDRLTQEAELQRALHFIATDIQEGKSVQAGAPERSGYRPLFKVVRPDGLIIGYYTRPRGDRDWSGPQIIYRKNPDDDNAYALIDQISAQPPQNCMAKDKETFVSSQVGFSLLIDNQTKATVCIRGHLLDSTKGIESSIQAVTRAGP
jgi:prepilin-type N-terminal cleavage/methylation domain-containing protein